MRRGTGNGPSPVRCAPAPPRIAAPRRRCSATPSTRTSPRSSTGRSWSRRRATGWSACRSGTSRCRPRARRGCACSPTPTPADDPDWRAAIEQNGWEEGRHKEVLADLVAAYGIALAPEPPYLRAARHRMGVSGHRLLRVHRQLLRLRPVRAGEALRLLPARAGRYVRAGDPGGSPPHPAVRQLARLAPRAACRRGGAVVRAAGAGGLGVPGLGADRHRARHGRRQAGARAGQQLHPHRQQGGQRCGRRARPS